MHHEQRVGSWMSQLRTEDMHNKGRSRLDD